MNGDWSTVKPSPHDRHVIGGIPSDEDEWTFMVAIEAQGYGFACAGALIAWDAVLTTAHCVEGAEG